MDRGKKSGKRRQREGGSKSLKGSYQQIQGTYLKGRSKMVGREMGGGRS